MISESTRNQLGLTKREAEVIGYLSKGLSNKQIAAIMFITVYSVKLHIVNLNKKLGTKSRLEIVVKIQPYLLRIIT